MSTAVGVLNIDKPQGITSHDVVSAVRRLFHTRQVGHAGTLDPLATGVLLVCVGAATRIASYLQAGEKTYRVTMRLGESTDTYDSDGVIMARRAVPSLSTAALDAHLDAFRGEIEQTPPLYSAIKRDGRPLYSLARAGETVELAPRPVIMHRIEIEQWATPDLTLRVTCSPGTYIRSLAHDLGERLGCGAHVIALRRLASGSWRADDAVSLDTLIASGDDAERFLHGLSAALAMLPPLVLPADEAWRFSQGQRLPLPADALPDGTDIRIFGPDEKLIGIGSIDAEQHCLRPKRVLSPYLIAEAPHAAF